MSYICRNSKSLAKFMRKRGVRIFEIYSMEENDQDLTLIGCVILNSAHFFPFRQTRYTNVLLLRKFFLGLRVYEPMNIISWLLGGFMGCEWAVLLIRSSLNVCWRRKLCFFTTKYDVFERFLNYEKNLCRKIVQGFFVVKSFKSP